VQIITPGAAGIFRQHCRLERRLTATSLIAAFHAAPDMDALAQVPGVSRAEPSRPSDAHPFHGYRPLRGLIAQAVANRWRLHELSLERRTLEQIFIELTCSEPPADQPGEAA
jgi:ABC-2 type transport system ATP-binding protein